jgi:hypothetical protein
MPNFRALSQMPADSGDLVTALRRDHVRRLLWSGDADCGDGMPAHVITFNESNHAPAAAVLERAARLSPAERDAKPVPAKAGGWVMHDPAKWDSDMPPVPGIRWALQRRGRVMPMHDLDEDARSSCLWQEFEGKPDYADDFIAYSTDTECPPWPEA